MVHPYNEIYSIRVNENKKRGNELSSCKNVSVKLKCIFPNKRRQPIMATYCIILIICHSEKENP